MAEGRKPGASIAAVALRHGLNPNLVHKWFAGQGLKRTGLTAPSAMASAPGLQFIPVGVTTANGPNPALALAASAPELQTRRAALAALPRVARTGTQLFQFAELIEGSRGWGRAAPCFCACSARW